MLPKFSVKKPFTIVVAMIIIAILGVVSFTKSTVDLLPNMNLPYAIVSTSYPGASPELVELGVTKPIEQRMATMANIKNISSVSSENVSMVIMEFSGDTNMDSAMIEVRESLDMLSAYFPSDVSSPMIMKLNPTMMPIMSITAYVEGMSIAQSSKLMQESIIPELEGAEGVASVSSNGLLSNLVNVTINQSKINDINKMLQDKITRQILEKSLSTQSNLPPNAAPGDTSAGGATDLTSQMPKITVTTEMLSNILSGQNFAMPAGSVPGDDTTYIVRTGDKIKSVEELSSLPIMSIPYDGFEQILLSDVADIVSLDSAGQNYAKVNGNDAIMLTFQKQSDFSTTAVTKNVNQRMSQLSEKYPNVNFSALMDQGDYITRMVSGVIKNLTIGAVFAVLILFLFLKNIKPTFVVGMSIVVSVVVTLVLMYFAGISLNVISLGGLALGIGMLVDNSIVVIENIYRLRAKGIDAKTAAIEGARQMSGAITASTLTTVIVFAPILFTTGITKQLFMDMGLTIAFSLTASLVTALTFVPMASSTLLQNNPDKSHKLFDYIKNSYGKLLEKSLKHKWIVIVIVVALLSTSILTALNGGTQFIPSTDMGTLSVNATMPDSFSKTDSFDALDNIYNALHTLPDLDTLGIMMGGGGMGMMMGGGDSSSSSSSATIYLLLKEDRALTTAEIAEVVREKTKHIVDTGVDISISGDSSDLSMLTGSAVSIDIVGKDLDTLRAVAKDVASIVTNTNGTVQVDDGLGKIASEIRVNVNKSESIKHNLTVAQVYLAVNKAIAETRSATTISTDTSDFLVYLYDDGVDKVTSDSLNNILIDTPMNTQVRVGDIAEISSADGFASIQRKDSQRYVNISASLLDGFNTGVVNDQIKEKLDAYDFPQGYSYAYSGEDKMIGDTFKDLFLMAFLAIIFIYLVMVAQFQSLKSPFIVLFTIPLAFTGGLLMLAIFGFPLSVVAMIGLILLTGIVVNNGIVFIDYVNVLRSEGYSVHDALIKSGKDRLRPIIMTALTTITALLASCFDTSPEGGMIRPMAVTTIGGLFYATILTLFLVPIIYELFNKSNKSKI